MIRFIAAIDSMRGLATDNGIPWDLPSDHAYYVNRVKSGSILMGYNTYLNHKALLHGGPEYVATTRSERLRQGFVPISNIDSFLENKRCTWVLGGSKLFESLLNKADELYITQVNGDFQCIVFFPAFEKDFHLVAKSKIKTENGIDFQYQIWRSNRLLSQKVQKSLDSDE